MSKRLPSLSRSLTVAIVGCVTLVSALVISINVYFTSEAAWESLSSQADEYAIYLKSSLEQPLWTLDEPAVRRIIRTVFRNGLFVRIRVLGAMRRIEFDQHSPDGAPTINRTVEITYKGKTIGTLVLEFSTRGYREKVYNSLLNSLVTVAAVLATLLVLTGLIFNHLLARPLRDLLNRIDHLSRGEPGPEGSEVRHQELTEIITRFDAMARQVTNREVSLRQSKSMLEEEIRERALVQAALEESEKRYRMVTEVAPVGMVVHGNREILYANPGALRLFGAESADQLLGSDITNLVHPDDRELFLTRARDILQTGKVNSSSTYRWRHLSGKVLELEAIGVPSLQFGKLAVLSLLRDRTQEKLEEAERAHLMAQLQQSQKMEAVGTLASGIAHDFNNILQAIGGVVQLMAAQPGRGPGDLGHLNEIDTATTRAKDLVDRLLTFSRRMDSNLGPVDLNQEVTRSVTILGRTLPKMIRIETNLAPQKVLISGDASQLEQVLLNLGNNAADAMPEGGVLSIGTSLENPGRPGGEGEGPGLVKLTVADSGVGMDASTVKQIFDPFFTTKEVGKGTGLGLSMVYGIVKSHGGRISCQSRPGEGTVFEIFFPAHLGPALDSPEREASAAGARGQGETILLVDDETSILNVARELLGGLGYRVLVAHSGEEALEVYQQRGHGIDLVILDMGMPGMGGKRCLELLKAQDPAVKVLVASGYSGEQIVEGVRQAGALDYLRKPYRLEDLASTVARLMAQ